MRIDDLFGDGEAETGILAEALVRPVGIEALKYFFDGIGPHPGTIVIDKNLDIGPKAPAGFEKNWITSAGKDFFLIFRLYGPEKPLFERTWRLAEVEKVQ